MKGSSRRKTALELALKVGGHDEEESDESKGRESTKRCECGGQFLIRCREQLDEGVRKTAATPPPPSRSTTAATATQTFTFYHQ